MMKTVVIGEGLAGTIASKTLRELEPELEIEIFEAERYSYYPRPNLIEFIAGRLPLEKVFAFPDIWADRQRIKINKETKVVKILADKKKVVDNAGRKHDYDYLIIATGAIPSRPSLNDYELDGVFMLRTLDDAFAIIACLSQSKKIAVLGGGLLGLEIARAVITRGVQVVVVEFFERLLPRQLDPRASEILKTQVEKLGIEVMTGQECVALTGKMQGKSLKFKDGSKLAVDAVIIAAGVTPEIALAREAGLAVNRGVIVDDCLRTSISDIYAVGDCTEHRGRVYGLIPASFEQARAAAYNILGLDLLYTGTVPTATLKVAGLNVVSTGLIDVKDSGFEVLTSEAPEEAVYKKIVLKEGQLVGAIWMGTKKGAYEIARLVMQNSNVEKWKNDLLDNAFDFSVIRD